MRGDAVAEEALLAREGAVDELVDDHELARRQVLAQRSDGRDRDDVGDARALQRVDIGAVVDARRREPVAAPVTRKEAQRQAGELGEEDVVGGLAPGAGDPPPFGSPVEAPSDDQ